MQSLHRFEQLSADIAGIYQGIQKIKRNEMVKYGLKGYFAQYLVVMAHYPDGVTAAQLCEACDKDKAAVSRAVAEMEIRGLVRREREKESGYRARVCLTEEGRKAAEFVCERVNLAVGLAGEGLVDRERVIFYQTLHRIAKNVQRLGLEGLPERSKETQEEV